MFSSVDTVGKKLKKSEKAVEHDGDCSWCTWNDPHSLEEKIGGSENQWKNLQHLEHSIVKNGKNKTKEFWILRRFAVTQTLAKNHQLKLVRKTHKE